MGRQSLLAVRGRGREPAGRGEAPAGGGHVARDGGASGDEPLVEGAGVCALEGGGCLLSPLSPNPHPNNNATHREREREGTDEVHPLHIALPRRSALCRVEGLAQLTSTELRFAELRGFVRVLRGERTLARGIAFIQTASERGRERQVMKPVHILAS